MKWSWLEKALIVAGLAGVDLWLLSNADKAIYQAWDGWTFQQNMEGRPATVGAFVSEKKTQLERWLGIEEDRKAISKPDSAAGAGPKVSKDRQPPSQALAVNAVVGRLTIPRLRLTAMVRQGVEEDTLRVALGHIPGTAMPGQIGNVGIAGHRDTLFRALRRVRRNDLILFETLSGRYAYRVQSTEIVGPRNVSVLDAKASPELTLVTCYPFYYVGSAPERFIVKARQEPSTS